MILVAWPCTKIITLEPGDLMSVHFKSLEVISSRTTCVFEKLQSQTQVWQTTYAALTTVLLIDAAIAPTTRFSRPLRPIILVLSGGLRIWCLGSVHGLHMFHMCFTCFVWLLNLRSHALNLRISEHSKLLHDCPQNLPKSAESVGIAPSWAMNGFDMPWCVIQISLYSLTHTAPDASSVFLKQEGISFGLLLLIAGVKQCFALYRKGFAEQVAFYSHGLVIWIGSSTSWKRKSVLQQLSGHF